MQGGQEKFPGVLVDTHAHLIDGRFDRDRQEVLERAKAAGVALIVNVGYDLESSRKSVALAGEFDCVYAAVGVHPHDAAQVPPGYLEELRRLAEGEKVVAVGETGLDYYRNLSPAEVQKKVFREHLALARELDLPVIIHDRDAHKDVLGILKEDGPGRAGGVLHCFSGDWEMARVCLEMGFFISIAGVVTYPKSSLLKEIAARVPVERLLVETDCPYLTPEPWRGRRNEPAYVRSVVECVANLRGMSAGELALITARNARSLFCFP
ncbi:MAG: TatD family hydrolase [Desulfotomaculales bacterium]